MTLFRRLLRRLSLRPQSIEGVDLVSGTEAALPLPERLNVDITLREKPWSVVRIQGIFREYARNVDPSAEREARYARYCLARFWLSAPVDQLEPLYASALGSLQRCLLEGPLPAAPLAPDEDLWRERLHRRLQAEPEAPERLNLLLALLPLFPPGVLRMPAALQRIPRWLLEDYARHCEPALLQQLRQPVGLLESSGGAKDTAAAREDPKAAPAAQGGGPPARPLPRLSPKSNQEALAYFRSEATVNRMAALLNLYALDPSDADTLEELAGLRRIIGQLWLNVEEESLEGLYRSPVGSVYRSLLASDFGAAPLSEADQAVRQELARWVADLQVPGAVNALLAVLPFFPRGKVSLARGADLLPGWVQAEVKAYQKT